ncbi:MAG: glycosyl hydrolase family 65 protein [Alphaproteobacteria bacterium]|nr:glycosyl hydrolase family 65 protein [Alphaproteobacteria bacterium]
MKGWSLVYTDHDPGQEGIREALCTLGNGRFATRGAASEAVADSVHYPGTYVAGCYNRLVSEIGGQRLENEDLINAPNWLPLSFRIADDDWFDLAAVEILSYRQELDLKAGLLHRTCRFRDARGRETELASCRLVHMSQPELAAQELVLLPLNWDGRIQIRSALDGRVRNAGIERYRALENRHLEPLETGQAGPETIHLKARTTASEITLALAARTRLKRDGSDLSIEARVTQEPGYIAQDFTVNVQKGERVSAEKVAALYTSRDRALAEPGLAARQAAASATSFAELAASHKLAWDHLWRHFDIDIQDHEVVEKSFVPLVLRLHIFHLLQTTSLNSLGIDAGVPARGLHGEAYRGHIFWDELFIFPFLNYRMPEITRALLMYRYRRLDAAREAAAKAGYRGAMYPWQSGSDGREESQRLHLNPKSGRWIPDNSSLQRHVNVAIAYNVYRYYEVTGDLEFMSFYGAEMVLEIARFWASIATYNNELDRYEILGVMGPDEYHDAYPDAGSPGINNNAYTNMMAVWNLAWALDLLELLPADRSTELREQMNVGPDEIAHWDAISRKMRIAFHDGDIISQFEGYDRLAELDWEGYREKYGDIHRLDRILESEDDTPNRYKLSKQADVLMLFYLFSAEQLADLFDRLGYAFDPQAIPRNIDYYTARTAHGSTLSRIVDAWVLARSDRAGSWQLFCEALKSDVSDTQGGTTKEGIHLGAMAGTIDLLQRCYTGMEARGDVLWLNPSLPDELGRLRLRIRYRGRALRLDISHHAIEVTAMAGPVDGVKVGLKDKVYDIAGGESRLLDL